MVQGQGNSLSSGDVAAAFEDGSCDHVIEGVASLGGQEHFYLEPNCSLIIPGEHEEVTVISSTQVGTCRVQGLGAWLLLLGSRACRPACAPQAQRVSGLI